METEIRNAINLLIKQGYLLLAGGVITSTGKLRMYNTEKIEPPKTTAVLTKKERINLREFSKQAEVPGQIKTLNFTFNANRVSVAAEKEFNRIVDSVDMQKLIEATKQYYADAKNTRVTLSNYFLDNVWQSVYDHYTEKPQVANNSYTGERSI